MTEDELARIKELEDYIFTEEQDLSVYKNELNQLRKKYTEETKENVTLAKQKKFAFKKEDLIFALTANCRGCQQRLAYPRNIGMFGSWYCSAILLGTAEIGTTHDNEYPFTMYEIKSDPNSH